MRIAILALLLLGCAHVCVPAGDRLDGEAAVSSYNRQARDTEGVGVALACASEPGCADLLDAIEATGERRYDCDPDQFRALARVQAAQIDELERLEAER